MMQETKLIVGLGTGRCGTRSLTRLLSLQQGVNVKHERKPALSWDNERDPGLHLRCGQEVDCDVFADVGFYYLPHVERLREEFSGITFVCLQRGREQTIESFCKHQARGRNWFDRHGSNWSRSFPVITGGCFAEQVGRYWDMYYERANELVGDDFQVYPTSALSDARSQQILNFCGFESPVVEAVHVGAGAP